MTICIMALVPVVLLALDLGNTMTKQKRPTQHLTEKNGNVSSFRHAQKSESFNQTHGFYIVS